MLTRLRAHLRALWQLPERLEALEAAHQELAQEVRERLDDRLVELDRLYAKNHSALGRIYRLKGWQERDDAEDAAAAAAAPAEGTRPKMADVLAAKFKR